MIKLQHKYIYSALLISAAFLSLMGPQVLAFTAIDQGKIDTNNEAAFQNASGFSSASQDSLSDIVATIIKAFLGLMGVIFIVYLVYAGYLYLTAAGDNQKVEKAVTTIQRAIIGLVIVVSAYAITAFVFKNLPSSAGGASDTSIR